MPFPIVLHQQLRNRKQTAENKLNFFLNKFVAVDFLQLRTNKPQRGN